MQTQRSQINYEGQNIYIGIDAHLKSWTVSVIGEAMSYQTFSQPPTVEALTSYLAHHFPGGIYHSVYEAGFSGLWAHYQLVQAGINNIVVNPADVPTSQKEKLQKTDPVDSKKLARSLRSGDLDSIYILGKSTMENRSLVRLRATIVKDLVRFKQRIKSFLYYFGIKFPEVFSNGGSHWSRRFIKWLKEEVPIHLELGGQTMRFMVQEAEQLRNLLLEITREIRTLSKTDKYSSQMKLLRTIPGVGFITSITFLVEIENIERFQNSDHFAGFVGLIPTTHSSGEKNVDGEMTFRGQKVLRKALIESSWKAACYDPSLSLSYNNYTKRMDSNKAIIRIARKVLNRMYFVLKNNKEYVPGVVK